MRRSRIVAHTALKQVESGGELVYLGIDPGVSGGWGIVSSSGKYIGCGTLPFFNASKSFRLLSVRELIESIDSVSGSVEGDVRCVVEHVGTMPGQGIVSAFNFGATFGQLLGALSQKGYSITLVRPQIWKKAMGLSRDKEAVRAKACFQWPEAASELTRKKDHNRAEALWLAEYLRTTYNRGAK